MKNKANSQRFKRVYSWLNFMKLLQNCSEFVKNLQKPAKSMSIHIENNKKPCLPREIACPLGGKGIISWGESEKTKPICRRGIRGGRSICMADKIIRNNNINFPGGLSVLRG